MKHHTVLLNILLVALTVMSIASSAWGAQPAVKLSTDKPEYIEGEELNIILVPAQDCNVVLLYITASGDAVRILPSDAGPDGQVKAGRTYNTPATGEDRGLYIAEPFGKEQIIAYATYKKIPAIPGEKIGDGLYIVPGGEKELDTLLPEASKTIWNLETFSAKDRGRFRKSKPENPIDMTGSAGRDVKLKENGIK